MLSRRAMRPNGRNWAGTVKIVHRADGGDHAERVRDTPYESGFSA
jgi:hypothetical protein